MTYTPPLDPPTYPCFAFFERDGGGFFGHTPYDAALTPVKAVYEVFQGCDFYPYRYRKVGYKNPAATLDVFIATSPDSKTYLATLARIYPTCCFCRGPMQYQEEPGWCYGYRAWPLSKGQCCATCFNTKVVPAQKAQRAAEEARYRAYAEAYRAKKDAER